MFNQDKAVVERARALLAAHCTAEQRKGWEEKAWLAPVFGSQGGVFGFGSWAAADHKLGVEDPRKLFYQVWEFDAETGEKRFRYCVLPVNGYGELPEFDCILGCKLLLEADEAAFRAIARVQWDWRAPRPTPDAYAQAVQNVVNDQVLHAQPPLRPYANADPQWAAQQIANEQQQQQLYQQWQAQQQYVLANGNYIVAANVQWR